jgi:mono/diheme cytochrome c family protein
VNSCLGRRARLTAGISAALFLGSAFLLLEAHRLEAGPLQAWLAHHGCEGGACVGTDCGPPDEWAGTWYWLRSPDEERRAVAALYNRYCIRCHGVDGRGVWDIPDVPDFTNARWQGCRSDSQLVHLILEGRGAVMPPFRGALSLEEAWGMARYLRTFVPGTETPRPDRGTVGQKAAYTMPEKLGTIPLAPPTS